MTDPVPSTQATSTRFLRAAGLGGLGFLASVVIENALRSPAPMPDATLAEISRYYVDRNELITVSQYFYATAIPCLLLFAIGVYQRLRAASPEAAPWGLVGAIAACLMTPLFGATMVLDVVLASKADRLAASPELTEWVWRLKMTFFMANVVALGTAVLAFGTAARIGGVGPRWLAHAACLAGVVGIAAAFPLRHVAEGSPWGLLGFVTFLVWLVFLAVTSVGMIRAERPSRIGSLP